jgi:FdhD protein
MWTPTESALASGFVAEDGVLGAAEAPERLALAVGFAFTEGIINGLQDIASMEVCPDRPDIVRMRLVDPAKIKVRRSNVLMTSSCGVCGGRDVLAGEIGDLPKVTDTLRMSVAGFPPMMEAMRQHQAVFSLTGGAHAAMVFANDQQILAVAEDLGRHNALDKVIGKCLLQHKQLAGCGVVLSSRLSFEMIAKSARAGFEIIAAVSAPSSLAIQMAERSGITLCGFVRGECATVYAHPGRIRELAQEADLNSQPTALRVGVGIP